MHYDILKYLDMGFMDHFVRLLSIRRLEARVRFSPAVLTGEDRKELAAATQAALEEQFEPLPAEDA